MKMIVKVAENDILQNTINDATTRKPRPIPTPAAFWSRYWNARVPSHKEQYRYDEKKHMTKDTYSHLNKAGVNENLRDYNENVDIRIVARAQHSSSSIVPVSIALLMSTRLLSSFL